LRASEIKPTTPPAIHMNMIVREVDGAVLRADEDEEMAELEQYFANKTKIWAVDEDHLGFVREKCRIHLAGFVRAWLQSFGQWEASGINAITVYFRDEAIPGNDVVEPTLTLNQMR